MQIDCISKCFICSNNHKKNDMATTTATILIGKAHQNDSGVLPQYLIFLTENSRPAFTLKSLYGNEKEIIIIPTIENMIDDLYLMVAVYILKTIKSGKPLYTTDRKSMYDIFTPEERKMMYLETKTKLKDFQIKFVFNLLDCSTLLNQIELIKEYPNDYEITVPFLKKEYNAWTGLVEFNDYRSSKFN